MFYEKQSFNRWWIWTMLLVSLIAIGYGILTGKADPTERYGILAGIVVIGLISVLLWFTHLETRIDKDGITLRFFPFQRVYYYVRWDEIASAQVRKYSALKEFGGYGIRVGFSSGKAYTISGNKGLQLELKSGRKFLLGTQKETELIAFLESLALIQLQPPALQ